MSIETLSMYYVIIAILVFLLALVGLVALGYKKRFEEEQRRHKRSLAYVQSKLDSLNTQGNP